MSACINNPRPEFHKDNDIVTAIVYFSQNTSVLCDLNLDVINKIKREVSGDDENVIILSGFASGDGKAAHNMLLSKRRLDEVVKKLNLKPDADNVKLVPYGESRSSLTENAASSDKLEFQRRFNRKVTIFIMPHHSTSLLKKTPKPQVKQPRLRHPNFNLNLDLNLNLNLNLNHQPWLDFNSIPPPPPSILDNLKKKVDIDKYQKMLNPCLGDYCLDTFGSLGSSFNLTRRLKAGDKELEIMSDVQKSFEQEMNERIQQLEDLRNPNRVY